MMDLRLMVDPHNDTVNRNTFHVEMFALNRKRLFCIGRSYKKNGTCYC